MGRRYRQPPLRKGRFDGMRRYRRAIKVLYKNGVSMDMIHSVVGVADKCHVTPVELQSLVNVLLYCETEEGAILK